MNNEELLISLAIKAGEEIMSFFNQGFKTDYKSDNSPVTEADIASNNIIIEGLKQTGIPVISEESVNLDYEKRKDIKEFWLIDPLDGTKQFVKGEREFTVNIARIVNNLPVEGVVYAPVFNKLYYGNIDSGAFLHDFNKENERVFKLPLQGDEGLGIVISKSHLNDATREFVNKMVAVNPKLRLCKVGSSLKFCCLAEGHSDIYPRIGSISEWDIAAGHAIIRASGGNVVNLKTGEEVTYNKEDLLTPDFIAFLDMSKVKFIFDNA